MSYPTFYITDGVEGRQLCAVFKLPLYFDVVGAQPLSTLISAIITELPETYPAGMVIENLMDSSAVAPTTLIKDLPAGTYFRATPN